MISITLLTLASLGPLQLDFPEPKVVARPGVAAPQAGLLDPDPHTDLVAVDTERDELLVARSIGGGFFAPPIAFATGPEPILVRLADFDGDGQLDALVAWKGGISGGLAVHLGDGLGGFGSPLMVHLPFAPADVLVEDLDGDGVQDALVLGALPNASTVLAYLGDGSGGFGAPLATDLGTAVVAIALGHLGGDSHLDLFAGVEGWTSSVMLFAGVGDGSFAPVSNLAVVNWLTALAVGDLDGDGNDDLVLISEGGPGGQASALWSFRGDGAGGFSAPFSYPADRFTRQLELVDLDGDGRLDALWTSSYGAFGVVAVHAGLGTGAFGSTEYTVVPSERGTTALDLGAGAGMAVAYAQGADPFVPLDLGFLGVVRRVPGEGFEKASQERVSYFDGRIVRSRDVDGDGLDDAVTLGRWPGGPNALVVHYGDGAGGFSGHARQTYQPLESGSIPSQLALGQLDGDGLVDALGVDGSAILFFQGQASGPLTGPVALGNTLRPIALADVDGDGIDELLFGRNVGGAAPEVLSVQALVGGALVELGQTPVVGAVGRIASGDFDDDGNVDLALEIESPRGIAVLRGNGGPTFTALQFLALPEPSGDLLAADLDGDGRPELVVSIPSLNLVVAWPNGGGAFGAPIRRAVGALPRQLTAADLDGDGREDVVVSHGAGSNLAILAGRLGGLLDRPRFFASSYYPVLDIEPFRGAPGQRPDLLLTTHGDVVTFNFQAFFQLENKTP